MKIKQSRPLFILILFILILLAKAGSDPLWSDGIDYLLPVGNDRSRNLKDLEDRIIGSYGDYRKSHITGHKHSGIDIKGDFNEPVYSIGRGLVSHIFRDFPHRTIYIRHQDERGTPFYSVYIHIEDIQVQLDENVTENTIIGRLFNQEELDQSDFGTPPHLHFEIRHNIDDNGSASFSCMTIRELNNYCMDPLTFFEQELH
jgi:murein DD-endopeptidase MepM/ murein hydrolase activator NlpD